MKFSNQDRQRFMNGYESSGLKQADYCQQQGISIRTLQSWRRRANEEKRMELLSRGFELVFDQTTMSQSPFQDLESTKEETLASSGPSLEVELPSGVKLKFFAVVTAS